MNSPYTQSNSNLYTNPNNKYLQSNNYEHMQSNRVAEIVQNSNRPNQMIKQSMRNQQMARQSYRNQQTMQSHIMRNPDTTYNNINQNPNSSSPSRYNNPNMNKNVHPLTRNQSFQNRQYNQQLIQLIAKIRSLQDDLLNQRFTNQSLQRKVSQQQRTIDSLQYELNRQSYQLQKYVHEVQLSNEKNIEILKYEENLRIVGDEIKELNDILVKRNKDYDLLMVENKQLLQEINKIIEEGTVSNLRLGIWVKDIDAIIEQNKEYLLDQGLIEAENSNKNNNNNKNYNARPRSQHSTFSNNNNNNNNSNQQQQQQGIFGLSAMKTVQMSRKIQTLRSLCNNLSSEMKQLNMKYSNQLTECNAMLMKQREKYIKLEYEYKLLESRHNDTEKRKAMANLQETQHGQQYQEQINSLIQKQQQHLAKIQQLNSQLQQLRQQNQSLKQEINVMNENHQYLQQVSRKESEQKIMLMSKQHKLLEETVHELTNEITLLNERLAYAERHCQAVLEEKSMHSQQHNEVTSRLNKKLRKLQEENTQLQIHIQQLSTQLTLAQQQLNIMHSQQQQQTQLHQAHLPPQQQY